MPTEVSIIISMYIVTKTGVVIGDKKQSFGIRLIAGFTAALSYLVILGLLLDLF